MAFRFCLERTAWLAGLRQQSFGQSTCHSEAFRCRRSGTYRRTSQGNRTDPFVFLGLQSSAEWISSVRTSEGSYTEVKTENSIDRIAGTAKNPRQTERVPADARFDFKVTVKVLDDENLLDTLLAGLKLLELDGIGGSVSRGYGKVKFEKLSLDGKDISADFDKIDPFAK